MKRPLLAVCIFLVCVCAGLNYGKSPGEETGKLVAGFLAGEEMTKDLYDPGIPCVLTGTVSEKTDKYFFVHSISIQNNLSKHQDVLHLSNEMIIEYPPGYEDQIRYGRTVWLEGTFRSFSHATNPGEFDQLNYYDSIGVCGKLVDVRFLQGGGQFSQVREWLYQRRCRLRERLYHVFPKQQAGVLCAMLLGEKGETDREIKDLFQRNGLIHILSISGMHITLIGMGLYSLLRRMGVPIWAGAVCSGAILIFYGLMTGMSVSATRAIGMFLLHMLGRSLFRTYDMLTALGVMAACLVLKNPFCLSNSGFLLSFLSVTGIGVIFPLFGSRKGGILGGLWNSLLAGMSIQIVTLPVQLWFYYEVPYWSLLVNPMVLPLMGGLVVSAMLACIPGAGFLGTPAGGILWYVETLCQWVDRLSLQPFRTGRPSAKAILGYYCLIGGIWLLWYGIGRLRKRKKRLDRKWMAGAGGLTLLLFFLGVWALSFFSTNSSVAFLDVGQGDCTVIQTSADTGVVYDCGSMNRKNVGENILIPYLKYRGISHLSGVFVSHGDRDHISGVLELIQLAEEEHVIIDCIYLPDIENAMEEYHSIFALLSEMSDERRPGVSFVSAGMELSGEGVSVEVVGPPKGADWEGNTASLCLNVRLESGKSQEGMNILLVGDVSREGEAAVMNYMERHGLTGVELLKVSHHGSKNATSAEFLKLVRPRIAVISCGRKNSYGHPHEETMERLDEAGAKVLRTDELGAIIFSLSPSGGVQGGIRASWACEEENQL